MERERAVYSRRNVLRAGVSASVAGGLTLATKGEAQAYAPPDNEAGARYRESDHVKAYYRTNRYETKNKS